MGQAVDPILWLNEMTNVREDITNADIVWSSHKSVLVTKDSLGSNVLKILDKVCHVLPCLAVLRGVSLLAILGAGGFCLLVSMLLGTSPMFAPQ